jgi:outer membrane murein-binding lipoprotein Lpp
MTIKRLMISVLLLLGAMSLEGAMAQDDFQQLDTEAQQLKREVLQLNADLMALQEEMQFPASTQLAVYVSVNVGQFFDLQSIEIQLDGKRVANYLYSQREVEALLKGGTQRVFLGNIKMGQHELVAIYNGMGSHDRQLRRGATLTFDKTTQPSSVELLIYDDAAMLRPEFEAKVWE